MIKQIEIITLIYKSVDYLKFIKKQLLSDNCLVDGWDVRVRIVANDATVAVLSELEDSNIPYSVYNDPAPRDFYLNRVYKCWNFAAATSDSPNICFVNSDMAFSSCWLSNLLKHHNGVNIPCSRLVESNKLISMPGKFGIGYNLGKDPDEFNEEEWLHAVSDFSSDRIMPSGLYMPCVFETARFKESGGYPKGNVFRTLTGLKSGYPNDREVYKSGDEYFFADVLEKKYNMKHITVFDSLVYHIQEGEKDE